MRRELLLSSIITMLAISGGCSEDEEISANDDTSIDQGATSASDAEVTNDVDRDTSSDSGLNSGDQMDRADAQIESGLDQDMNIDLAQDAGVTQDDDMMTPEPLENLILDPSFEEGLSAWGVWGGATRVASDAHDGTWSLRATNGNGAEQRVAGLTPNATYRLSGWGKTESDEPLLIGVKDYGSDQAQLNFTQAEYTMDTLDFTMGPLDTEAVIFVYKHRGETSGYADSLTLTLESTPTPTHPNADLELVWSDEFDGSGPLDDSKWTFEEGFQRNRELQWYQQENAFREHGMLVIEGRRDSRPNPTYVAGSDNWKTQRATIDYTSASVITRDRFEWRYGRLEVRAKVTNYTGTWPAIWTLGVDCEWPSNGEVDVMENYGGDILANFAWGTNQRWNAQWDSSHHPVSQWGEGWTDEFHLWALDWSEDQMTITLDGVVLNTVDLNITSNGSSSCAGRSPFRQSHYLLLNLALGGAGGSVDTLTFPTRYIIDYVRVYQ
jgi:beta-glucanase (GH16 family)